MRKTLIVLGCMSLGMAHAQQGREHTQHNGATKRVGINTEKPVATLELSKVSGVPTTQVQGFLLPHLDQAERNAMEKEALTNGLMIFNTTKNCIDWWDGAHWQCTDGRYQDEHGDDFNPVKSFTGNYTHPITSQDFTRNNCVAPQTGTTVSFTSQAITKTYVSNISQEDANEQAKQQALAEFARLGQEYANQNGQCESPSYTGSYTHPITTQDFTRNNCVAPQVGTTVSYTSQSITKTYVSNISQEDANEQARQQALAEFNQLGQGFANTNGHCESPLPETSAIRLPNGITIDNGQRIIASIYDTDYLPYSTPTSLASWNNVGPIVADGAADKTIDVQGKVTTMGLNVTIPVKTTGSGTVPAYKTYIRIPAERTQDGQARVLELSWASQAFNTSTKSINATIKAVEGDLNVKKLDLKGGLGSDFKGLELGTFVMPQSATDGNLPANYKGKYEVRVISGIPDKNFAKETIVNGENKGYLHQFIYLPVQGPDGKMWLNNNLGADYANVNSPHFNPAQTAINYMDRKAAGSVFGFGRTADGHELVNWKSDEFSGVASLMFPDLSTQKYVTTPGVALSSFVENCPDGWETLGPEIGLINTTLVYYRSSGSGYFNNAYGLRMDGQAGDALFYAHKGPEKTSYNQYDNRKIPLAWFGGLVRCIQKD